MESTLPMITFYIRLIFKTISMTLVMSLEMTIDNVYDNDDNDGKGNVKSNDSRSREVGEFRHVLLPMFANC